MGKVAAFVFDFDFETAHISLAVIASERLFEAGIGQLPDPFAQSG